MIYKFVYTKSAVKDIDQLDQVVRRRILKKMDEYIAMDDPMKMSSLLKGFDIPTFRFRVGDYRIVFRQDKKTKKLVVLVVLKIQHRKEVYN